MNICLFLLAALVATAVARPDYQELIPNGNWVPHPCKPNFMWKGVGHKNPRGGGELNPFGQQFITYNKDWSRICRLDADGDGLTNGQELGDPNCVWQPGQQPERVSNISHPGVCTPWSSSACQAANSWVDCNAGEFQCDAIKEPHVRNVSLRFPRTKVPVKETSYMCKNFDLPAHGDFHLIATQPIIDNPNVMHHIALIGCENPSVADTSGELYDCMMGMPGCSQSLGLWTLGMDGECFYREAGYRIGNYSGITKAVLQFHWTNYNLRDDYYDASGMTLHYTSQRRPYDMGSFSTGELFLEIPPGRQSVVFSSTCTAGCTRQIVTKPTKIVSALSHMHYLGVSERIERYRNGVLHDVIVDDPNYSYDTPNLHVFDPPLELLPGDEMKTTCVYQSLSSKRTVYYGAGTYDEMCFGIFQYFPKDAMGSSTCLTYKGNEFCAKPGSPYEINGCNLNTIFNLSHPDTSALMTFVLDSCSYAGSCRVECPAAIAAAKERSGCLRGSMGEYVTDLMASTLNSLDALRFSAAFTSCTCPASGPGTSAPQQEGEIYSGNGRRNSPLDVAVLLFPVLSFLSAL